MVAGVITAQATPCSAETESSRLGGLVRAGRFEEAERGFAAYLQAHPDDPVALYYLGRLTTNLPASTRYFERVVGEYPEHPLADDALLGLCDAAYAGPLGLYLKARRLYRQLVDRYPGSEHVPMALYRIGLTHLIVHEADSAAAAFGRAAAGFPASAAAVHCRLGLAEVEAERGNLRTAIAMADSLHLVVPDSLRQSVATFADNWRRKLPKKRSHLDTAD